MSRILFFLLAWILWLPISEGVFPEEVAKKIAKDAKKGIPSSKPSEERPLYLHIQFTRESLQNPTLLLMKIKNRADSVSAFLNSAFSSEVHDLLVHADDDNPHDILIRKVVGELNRIILGNLIYDVGTFAGVQLSTETENLLKDPNIGGESLVKLNRLLLEDAYPEELLPLRMQTGSFLAQAKPIPGPELTKEERDQRFVDMYAGKPLSDPWAPQEAEKKQEETTQSAQALEEQGSGFWFWVVGAGSLILLFWSLNRFGSKNR